MVNELLQIQIKYHTHVTFCRANYFSWEINQGSNSIDKKKCDDSREI